MIWAHINSLDPQLKCQWNDDPYPPFSMPQSRTGKLQTPGKLPPSRNKLCMGDPWTCLTSWEEPQSMTAFPMDCTILPSSGASARGPVNSVEILLTHTSIQALLTENTSEETTGVKPIQI